MKGTTEIQQHLELIEIRTHTADLVCETVLQNSWDREIPFSSSENGLGCNNLLFLTDTSLIPNECRSISDIIQERKWRTNSKLNLKVRFDNSEGKYEIGAFLGIACLRHGKSLF